MILKIVGWKYHIHRSQFASHLPRVIFIHVIRIKSSFVNNRTPVSGYEIMAHALSSANHKWGLDLIRAAAILWYHPLMPLCGAATVVSRENSLRQIFVFLPTDIHPLKLELYWKAWNIYDSIRVFTYVISVLFLCVLIVRLSCEYDSPLLPRYMTRVLFCFVFVCDPDDCIIS